MSSSTTSSTPSVTKQWTLAKEDELRLEIDTQHACVVTLLSGTAELFGCELALDHDYTIEKGTKTAIFTWLGCELRIKGAPKSAYTANETPMISYINTHAALETLRNKSREAAKTSSTPSTTTPPESKSSQGPRVLIVGPMDAGKSTLARILLNYAVRAGSHPTYVDLDVGQNAITIPGSVAATSIEHPIGVSTSDSLIIRAPLVYYYGHTTPSTSQELYQKLVERLAAVVEKRLEKNEEARHSGLIVNTCGWVDGAGYDLIVHAQSTFHVDVILVVGHERLYSDLKADSRLTSCTVIKLSKSGGVVSRDLNARRASRMRSIREYFYGISGDLHPHQKILKFTEVELYRVGGGPQAPNTALPIGTRRLLDPNRVAKFIPNPELQHTILAVPYTTDATQLLESNVAGFIYVTSVDDKKRVLACLTPAPGDLPSNMLLAGSVKWLDS